MGSELRGTFLSILKGIPLNIPRHPLNIPEKHPKHSKKLLKTARCSWISRIASPWFHIKNKPESSILSFLLNVKGSRVRGQEVRGQPHSSGRQIGPIRPGHRSCHSRAAGRHRCRAVGGRLPSCSPRLLLGLGPDSDTKCPGSG